MSQEQKFFERVLPALVGQEIAHPDRQETTENAVAATKLAAKFRAANVNLPPEVWQAIEEGRTQDFQNHPDFMAAVRQMTYGQNQTWKFDTEHVLTASIPPQKQVSVHGRAKMKSKPTVREVACGLLVGAFM